MLSGLGVQKVSVWKFRFDVRFRPGVSGLQCLELTASLKRCRGIGEF